MKKSDSQTSGALTSLHTLISSKLIKLVKGQLHSNEIWTVVEVVKASEEFSEQMLTSWSGNFFEQSTQIRLSHNINTFLWTPQALRLLVFLHRARH